MGCQDQAGSAGKAESKNVAGHRGGPENREKADQATEDNDLSTGHSQPGDGGDDNKKQHPTT
jgi:hypothetical protein